ncbi:hypothetical protein [Dyella sp. C9]|uniref:hypothetical protein n=1 Tax=Dyella sp. C9 TaxID=2202154 RepID=UPI000DEFD66A|nr:hypothetical protein [Dyella sp. C9]
MKSKLLLIVVALAACSAAASAQNASGRITFVGRVVAAGCSSSQPVADPHAGMGNCKAAGRVRAVYAEDMKAVPRDSDVAMLDYFSRRGDRGAKYVVTRLYR